MSEKSQRKNCVNLYLANPRGFCAGVDRAIKMVEESLKIHGKPVYVRHEIVHNQYVVKKLREQGAIFIDELNEIPDNKHPVIFSAHGVPKSVPEEAKLKNITYFDATCPLVSKIHREVEFFAKKNFEIILIGHRNHPEVIGTMGQTNAVRMHLIENISDAKKINIKNSKSLAYVTQTTLSIDDTAEIIKILKRRFPQIVEPKKEDICYATTNRQKAVKKIAEKCDSMVIIGASNSSNSLRLVEVAKNNGCPKSILIQSNEDFNWEEVRNNENIGLSASASAPEELVSNFIDECKRRFEVKIIEDTSIKENVKFNIPNHLKKAS
ncbi:MAG: 4-hydroxy-3-methylbut-2-enyl diphosphate reductase [Alphaproteobacteria bacterium MarineAlpha5_Bin11]|nr:MAG: 4-hydroxy-3-methylbut-2-enyl diphosphate reductase [Alphaproteobacteria bacterium MarineAlpha5_Bin11]PPR52214.1 MAG: 4-hydroxy-3-methylbut-2-enyl diphosphate reductase [Alphaproteobacteria bacterium MarineAlpha5_Bin10]|tara:strand:- start:9361 stop:10329 length:969 start_codon:yes stop_codon:yes gene_type:complete